MLQQIIPEEFIIAIGIHYGVRNFVNVAAKGSELKLAG
jgi:hypothetical protein